MKKKKKIDQGDDLLNAIQNDNFEEFSELLNTDKYEMVRALNHLNDIHLIIFAAQKGSSEILKLLLDQNWDINVTDCNGLNALHYAAINRNCKCCNILLERGIKYNVAEMKCHNRAIHYAAEEGFIDLVKQLLKKGVSPNVQNKKCRTPVHVAAFRGRDEILSLLLNNEPENGNRKNKDNQGKLPLHDCAQNGWDKCCTMLIEKSRKNQINETEKLEKCTPLILAARKGHDKCCEVLSEANVNLKDFQGNTALHHVCIRGFNRTLKIILDMKPDVHIKNHKDNKAIHLVVQFLTPQYTECLQILFENDDSQDPGVNKAGQSILAIAANHCSNLSFKYLLEQEIFFNQINKQDNKGNTPLHLALRTRNIDASNLILDTDIDNCFIMDHKGNLPLHIAAWMGNTDLCRRILHSGRSFTGLNEKNVYGTTPLHFATSRGSMECCNFLMKRGAILETKDNDGYTPFHLAAAEGHLSIFEYFLKEKDGHRQALDAIEVYGNTPLHLAVYKGRIEIVELILKKCQKKIVQICNKNGNNSLDEAFAYKEDAIFKLILNEWPENFKKKEKNVKEKLCFFEKSIHDFMHKAIESERR